MWKKLKNKKELAIIIGLAAAVLLIGRCYIKDMEQTADVFNSGPEQQTEQTKPKVQTQTKHSDRKEPLLTLVNSTNPIPEDWKADLVPLKNGQSIDRRAYKGLQKMFGDARAEGLDPLICSSYRTEELQTRLYNEQVSKYRNQGSSIEKAKKEAAVWIAVPGASEHQLGLAVDIVSESNQHLNHSQDKNAVQKWLMKNCWKYGFILRYPTGKSDITGIGYEPWHYRYVGKKNAKIIYKKDICLEEYLKQ